MTTTKTKPKAATGIQVSIEVFGPVEAAAAIGTMGKQRLLKQRHIQWLVTLMEEGEWNENNPDPIMFDPDGQLINGQHRMQAIISTGREYLFHVHRNVPREVIEYMDGASPRTFADHLSFLGESGNVKALATTTLILHSYHTTGILSKRVGPTTARRPTRKQQLAILTDNPGLRDSIVVGERMRHRFKGGAAKWAAIHYILTGVDAEDCEFFLDRMLNPFELPEGSPLLALRKRLLDTIGRDLGETEYSALVLKAWNQFRDGTSIQTLVWRRGGSTPEPFPVPH